MEVKSPTAVVRQAKATIFFAVAFLLSAKQSKVVDLVGKFMAPVMFVALLVIAFP